MPHADDKSLLTTPQVRQELMRLRRVDNFTNLGYLALDYFCIALVIATAVAFAERRAAWGLAWGWNTPVFATAILVIGGLQHRLAGLGHESSHYTLLGNKFWNDLVGDLFCMFPVMSTVAFYRLFHLAHHQYTNDHDLDPDIVNLGPGKQLHLFPMPRWNAIFNIYFRFLIAPRSFSIYQWEYFKINALGKGDNPYVRRVAPLEAARIWPRPATWLGIVYLAAVNIGAWVCTTFDRPILLAPLSLFAIVIASLVAHRLPDGWVFRSALRQPYSTRTASVLRLAFYTILLASLAALRRQTEGRSAIYTTLLWLVPLMTTFPYFMLLRDIYQHTNADDGRLTNSRVFRCDPLTTWAVFVHGQGLHIPHHLFPAIPHFRLRRLHRMLRSQSREYRKQVVECHGTFANRSGRPTILDVLTTADAATSKVATSPAPRPHYARKRRSHAA